MASTKAGDVVESLQQLALERMVSGSQAHYKLLTKAHLSIKNPQASEDFMVDAVSAFKKLQPQLNTMMQKAADSLVYLSTGVRPTPAVPRAVDPNSLVATIRTVTNLQAFKKAGGYGGALSPEQLDETYNFASSSMAFKNSQQAHEAILDRYYEIFQENKQSRSRLKGGFARIPNSGACKFCIMLVSRGPVYSEDTAGFQSHRHCSCTPVFADENWTLPPDKQKIVAEVMEKAREGKDRQTYQEKKATKAGNEALVKYGYRKRVVEKYPKTRKVVGDNGEIKEVPDGFGTRVTYVKTQESKQQDLLNKASDTRAYKKIMASGNKPLAHSSLPVETVEQEMSRLRYDLGLIDDDGKFLGPITSDEGYVKWAKNHGVFDETMIQRAKENHADHVDAWYELNRTNQLDKALRRVDRAVPRLDRINKLSLNGETRSLDWWLKRTRESSEETMQLALRKAGIVYTSDLPVPSAPSINLPKPPTTAPLVTKLPPARQAQIEAGVNAASKELKSLDKELASSAA